VNVGSLFSGIGGFDLGLERAGMRIVWQCEADTFCRRILARHWPTVPCYADVRSLRQPAPIDVLCGGFPCQDLSSAGKRLGIDGARSGIWSEYARLIGELRPRYVVVENVAALLIRGFERVLGDLAALGYDAEWDCIPASAVGAYHQRDRVWIVAYPNSNGLEADADHSLLRREADQGGHAGHDSAEVRTRVLPSVPERNALLCRPPVLGMAHGVPNRVDRLRSLGNALVPQIAEWIGRRILEAERVRAAAETVSWDDGDDA
jgi:DNA (cytosine-5)-methyltransferase 1